MQRSAIVAASVLACGLAFQAAQASSLASSSSSVTGLTFRLVDLDTSDGITPWIQFQDHNHVVLRATETGQAEQLQVQVLSGTPFPPPQGGVATGGVQAASGTGFQTSVTLDSVAVQDVQASSVPVNSPVYTQEGRTYTMYGTKVQDGLPLPYAGEFSWTLSPNTALVLEGTLEVTSEVDLTQLAQGALLQGVQAGQYALAQEASAYASISLYAGAVYGQTILPTLQDSARLDTTHLQKLSVAGVTTLSDSSIHSKTQSFILALSNTTAFSRDGTMFVVTSSSSTLGLAPADGPVIPGVPEPGTWAFMGLGLGLMAWRVRASRH